MTLNYQDTMPTINELEAAGLNNRQIYTLMFMVNDHCTIGSYHADPLKWVAHYNVKKFAVSMIGKEAFVVITCGLIGKENNMQRMLCRETWVGSIGPRGGLKAADHSKGSTKADAKRAPLIYGWR